MNTLFVSKIIILLLLSLSLNASVFAQSNYSLLEKQVSEKKYKQAWQQALRLAKSNEGEPRFDYLYGISALETGHYDKAIFSLERVIVNQPNIIRPRLELARAYLKINNSQAALREFKQVLSLNPPVAVQRNVNRYIQAMRKNSKESKKWILDGLLTLATGYDSNANFGADTASFDVPVFGSVILKDESLKQDSPFIEVRAQLNYRYILSDAQGLFLNTQISHKHFSDVKKFNLSNLNIQAGNLFNVGKLQYQLSLHHKTLQLNEHAYSNTLGLSAGIARELFDDRVVAVSVVIEDYEHKKQELRDVHRYKVSARYGFGKDNMHHQIEALLGVEKPKHNAGEHYARNSIGAAYTARKSWNSRHSSSIRAQLQRYKYGANDPIYSVKRKDQRVLLKVGHSINLSSNLSAFVDVGYIKNNSNLNLYETDKTVAQIGINYQF